MNDQSRVDCLTEASLEQVTGGMDCNTAKAVGYFYMGLSDFYMAMGKYSASAAAAATGAGIIIGACN